PPATLSLSLHDALPLSSPGSPSAAASATRSAFSPSGWRPRRPACSRGSCCGRRAASTGQGPGDRQSSSLGKTIDIDVLDSGGDSLYVSERKVYPRDVSGRFDRLRKAAVFWLLDMYFVLPWLQWDGRQAVLFDLPARKFHVWGLTFWPQDFSLLAVLLVILALTLF